MGVGGGFDVEGDAGDVRGGGLEEGVEVERVEGGRDG